eukprot:NODE_2400_length_1128_cov_9.260426_g1995_i0.p3 GENE.NODE_2400_length_1128_cov_9.260426_g1995_i0~~NODE_2400_length_1128_cov_9.260426_g1995_i0.p3  ORF type:complete len:91 (-),score=1.15 NODE_2400_length_1128_cov_9.260426_g1995_i0:304-576(-)
MYTNEKTGFTSSLPSVIPISGDRPAVAQYIDSAASEARTVTEFVNSLSEETGSRIDTVGDANGDFGTTCDCPYMLTRVSSASKARIRSLG